MFPLIFLEFLSLCLAFSYLGFWLTLAVIVSCVSLGILILQYQGFKALQDLQAGHFAASRTALVAAGLLFLSPGFFSKFMAILGLFPPTRRLILMFAASALKRAQNNGRVIIFSSSSAAARPPMRDVTPKDAERLGSGES